jgi:hypothetical protein
MRTLLFVYWVLGLSSDPSLLKALLKRAVSDVQRVAHCCDMVTFL